MYFWSKPWIFFLFLFSVLRGTCKWSLIILSYLTAILLSRCIASIPWIYFSPFTFIIAIALVWVGLFSGFPNLSSCLWSTIHEFTYHTSTEMILLKCTSDLATSQPKILQWPFITFMVTLNYLALTHRKLHMKEIL